MNFSIAFFLVVSALISGALTYAYYFYKRERNKAWILPAVFRFITIFSLLLLLLNLKFTEKQFSTIKPSLKIAIDDSKSIALAGADEEALTILELFRSNDALNKKFQTEYFVFGNQLRVFDSLQFTGAQTNIDNALSKLDDLSSKTVSPIVMISDGIQTVGKNYAFSSIGQKVYPVIVGDTTESKDLSIGLINSNSYVSLGNTFEVQVLVNYFGSEEVESEIQIEKGGRVIERKRSKFSANQKSALINFELEAEEKGAQLYRALVKPLEGERELLNNQQVFEIEVVDEKIKVAIVYSYPHPDLGMMKRSLESHELKQVDLIDVTDWNFELDDYSVFILYEPSADFEVVFGDLNLAGENYFLVAGSATNWGLLNRIQSSFTKEASFIQEDFYPVFSEDFQSFFIEDIGFSDLPSLSSNLGELEFKTPFESILMKQVNGIVIDQPLLGIYEENGSRRIALFGQNMWKWRLQVFKRDNSFERFDGFFGSLIQYLYLSDKKQSLELYYSRVNYEDQELRIRARKFDSNLNLNLTSPLEVKIDDELNSIPMFVNGSFYEARVSDLEPGVHNFVVNDLSTAESRTGKIEVMPFSAEQVRLTSDVNTMNVLGQRNNGKTFFSEQAEDLIEELLNDPEYTAVEKIEKKQVSLIDQNWLFGLIVLSLTIEWIIRKYRGMV